MNSSPPRRAVLRWAWRLFRGEWRQQILIIVLLSAAVATATFGATFAFNVTAGGEADFGAANQRIRFSGSDPSATATDIAAARAFFGPVDVIFVRELQVPGLAARLEVRARDPHGTYTAPMLALRHGRYPTAAHELAVSDRAARTLDAEIGSRVDLEGDSWTIVGIVENPGNLDDEFALAPLPSPTTASDTVTLLVRATSDRVEEFRPTMTVAGNVARESRANDKTFAAIGTLMLATIGMLLVALIAAAGFVVIAQRRQRQFGLLAAIGATERHVRGVTLVNGFVVGGIAAVAGTSVALAVWAGSRPWVERAAGHRIDGLSVPLWLLAAGALLAVVTAAGSAWWPARSAARVPIMQALSTRPPQPAPAHRSAVAAVILIVIGVGAFALSRQKQAALILVGTVATPLGVLLIAPLAVRAAARSATRLPIAGRLALRDLGRYPARAGAALAAISMALGIPVAIIVIATASEYTAAEGNLSARQLLVQNGTAPEPFVIAQRTPAETGALDAQLAAFAATLDGATVVPLDMAVDPELQGEPDLVHAGETQALELARRRSSTRRFDGLVLYVATPEVFRWLGVDPASGNAHELFTADASGEFFFLRKKGDIQQILDVGNVTPPRYTSLPSAFVSPDVLEREGWHPIRAGWLIETRRDLTADQRAAARALAVDAGLSVEDRQQQTSLTALRSGATAAGVVLALGVLAMTVGLMRTEAADDVRTLTATGASSTIRRTLTAATAGALAALGVVLGILGSYVVLAGAYLDDLGDLARFPVAHLAVLGLGVPVLAVASGWLLAGREPHAIARTALD